MTRKEVADLKAAIEAIEKSAPKDVTVNRAFATGDHWQNGDGWIGPRPQPDEDGATVVLAELQKGFTSSNRILEVCQRHAGGVAGREPSWQFTPREPTEDPKDVEDDETLKELHAALTVWWNDRAIPTKLFEAVVSVLWGTRSVLRLYVPAGIREDSERVSAESLEAALSLIYLDVVDADKGTVHQDPDTKLPLGIIKFKDDKDEDVVELSYLDESRENTIVETFSGEGSKASEPLVMGGRVTMFELRRSALVTEQVRQQQRAHNLALSMLPRNLVTGGFLERVIMNAQMPGYWKLDPDTQEPTEFVPQKLRLGSGTTTFLEGVRGTDLQTGRETVATPSVEFREPVPVDSSVDGANATYKTILEEARQGHIITNSDARQSGKSRVEARKDYESSLKSTKLAVEAAGRWLMETVIALAENFYGSPGQYTETYRADFVCSLDTGVVSAEERKQNTDDVAAGLIPKSYAQRAIGIDDTDAAQTEIDESPESMVGMLEKRAKVFELLATHLPVRVAAQMAGFDEEQIALIPEEEEVDETDEGGFGGGAPSVEEGFPAGDEDVA